MIATGINDIANGIMTGADYKDKIPQLVDIYMSQFRRMYEGGARHFLVMPVPPFDRTPLARNGPHHELFVELVHLWNFRFYDMIGSLRSDYADADVRSWDWHAAMDEIIDNASSYGLKELKGSCWPYARITHYAPMAQDAECHFPLSEYLWKDTAHPTWRVHELLSKEVIRVRSVPSSCSGTLLTLLATNAVPFGRTAAGTDCSNRGVYGTGPATSAQLGTLQAPQSPYGVCEAGAETN